MKNGDVKGLGGGRGMFGGKKKKQQKEKQIRKSFVAEDPLSDDVIEALSKRFMSFAKTNGGTALKKDVFVPFLRETMAEFHDLGMPSEKDLEEACKE